MTIRIIDHKKIDLTESEWQLYQEILKGYDPKLQPSMMFQSLFETDKNGMILFVSPPRNKAFTWEIMCYLFSVQQRQALSNTYSLVDKEIEIMHEKWNLKMSELDTKIKEMEEKISKLS